MSKITQLLDSLDFSKLIPDLGTLLGWVQLTCNILILAGPIIILILGLFYLFLAPGEANHKAGFRTFFGMGSVDAWRYIQKMAGYVFIGLGGLMTIAMVIVCLVQGGKEIPQLAQTAIICLLIQAGLTLMAWLGLSVLATVMYDKNGRLRGKIQ